MCRSESAGRRVKTSPESFQTSFKYSQPYGDGLSGLHAFPNIFASRHVQVEMCKPKRASQHKCGRNVQAEICRLSGPTSTAGRKMVAYRSARKRGVKNQITSTMQQVMLPFKVGAFKLGWWIPLLQKSMRHTWICVDFEGIFRNNRCGNALYKLEVEYAP